MFGARTMAVALLGATLTTASFSTEAQQRYRWTDDDGSTRVADRIPPDAAGKRIEVLSPRGFVIRVIEAEATPDERAARVQRQEAERQADIARDAQARRDRMLLDSFTSVEDLVNARDTRVSALAAQINVSQAAADNLAKTVDDLEARVEQAGDDVPAPLAKRLEDTREQLDATLRFVAAREQEQAEIQEQFADDIARFERLRGGAADPD